ncbi:hypothetical protein, partial [uncultured Negativibacillus sp.]|uniref:hypothetical protein n=1 Tax=uncultured Negativibacillus sp. TaxID=1980696 RepID=UPI0025F8C20B
MEKRQMQWRIVGVFVVMLTIASGLMVRLYALSMNVGLEQAAQSQSAYTLQITTTRGQIYDRNLQPLTDTEQRNYLAVLPTDDAVQACAEQITGTSRRLALDAAAQGTPFVLPLEDGQKVYAADVENFTVSSRLPHDPSEQLAVHLLGYLDGEGNGVSGIEQAYNDRLAAAGEQVTVRCQVDALGRPMENGTMQVESSSRPPQQGVILTLDKRMQQVVEQVGEQIDQGAIVVMDVPTGASTASASCPQYDHYHLEAA